MSRKQERLPGTEGKQHKDIDAAAEAYVEKRDKRMALLKEEVDLKGVLLAAMKKHELDIYRNDDFAPPLLVTVMPGEEKVKVKKLDGDDEDEGTD